MTSLWKCDQDDVPSISDILAKKKKNRPLQITQTNQVLAATGAVQTNCEMKFPSKNENPLYSTTSKCLGNVPQSYHQSDRYYPRNTPFSSCPVNLPQRYTGLNTAPTPTKV
eukprot:GHVL01019431.1.p1 GENE.GHVL01019431.1~~GHVL01019431.1.p1  ORF type:complete len:111 (+),score=20.87 GHVL01019431.1:101-433(+)